MPDDLDAIADALYALPPEEFVPARDDQVSEARSRGDRELARALGRLRRPTRPAWLANLLARHRAEQLDGLVSLAAGLAQAQRTLDGSQLRALSSQRNRAVAAMAREAGRLAQDAGSPATEAQLRELQGILEAALAQPEVAEELKAGRLTRTLRYTGFGPDADPHAVPLPPQPPQRATPESGPPTAADEDRRSEERAARQRELRRDLDAAEQAAHAARDERQAAQDARDDARERHADAREEVARLAAELDRARDRERGAAEDERASVAGLREATRAATSADAEVERLRARLDALG
ncbi:hypothetical protein [Pseudonocardia sp.]|uniref:hypothetical protein n=1 Tax=Pseudonocardia sp. TaxID=60912 RepID=UPI003D0C35DD